MLHKLESLQGKQALVDVSIVLEIPAYFKRRLIDANNYIKFNVTL